MPELRAGAGGQAGLIHLPLTPRRGTSSGRVSLEKGDADGSAGARSRLDPDGTQPPPQIQEDKERGGSGPTAVCGK